MKTCKSCQTLLLNQAQFCHNCGREVAFIKGSCCSNCQINNPPFAKFCFHCGYPINLEYVPNMAISPYYRIDFSALPTLATQLKDAFFISFSQLLYQLQLQQHEAIFIDTIESEAFRLNVFEEAIIKLSTKTEHEYLLKGNAAFQKIEYLIEGYFLDLGERLLVEYTKSIIPYPLSYKVLYYQQTTLEKVYLSQVIQDFLQLEEEDFRYYLHTVQIPQKKLRNAQKSYYTAGNNEFPLLFVDQTIFGSAKTGLILTPKGIYWKAHFHAASTFSFSEITNLTLKSKQLSINHRYFNISKSFNFKLCLLLNRMKHWFKR